MANKRKDLTGQKFGKLTVIEYSHTYKNKSYWKCLCECGNISAVKSCSLTGGKTKSCGCNKNAKKHGMSDSKEFQAWTGMKSRCKNVDSYKSLNITVCERWLNSFENFLEDMGKKPGREYSIERLDNSKGYNPENCIWALSIQQNNNKRNCVVIEAFGKIKTLPEWSREVGISQINIRARLRNGWTVERALSQQVDKKLSSSHNKLDFSTPLWRKFQ